MEKDFEILGYQIEYPAFNKKLYDLCDGKIYKAMLAYALCDEASKGFRYKKINKATSKGTKVSFIPLKLEDFNDYLQELHEMANVKKNKEE